MKQLNEQQIQDNWSELRGIINNTFSGERLEKLNMKIFWYEKNTLNLIGFLFFMFKHTAHSKPLWQ